jgi:hypothetical protein
MSEINKVPANAGAQWLLEGFALLRKAPVALGLLGLIWGGLSALAQLTGQMWLSLIIAVLGPLLFGGMIYAAREVEQGRRALPVYLLQGLREGKLVRFLAMLLPQLAALLVLALLLVALLGTEQLQQLAEVMQKLQTDPDPELLDTIPAGRLLLWLVLVFAVSVAAGFFTLMAIPEVMFTERGGLAAMGLSFRTCVRNIGAVLVLLMLLVFTMFALSIAINIIVALLAPVVGAFAALFAGQLLLMSMLLPLIGATLYSAWRSMLGGGAPASKQHSGGIEV